jgi:dTDP-4-dehydrorhamnose 3,5-epimerase-like enzyme
MIAIQSFELRLGDDRGKTYVFENGRTGQFMLLYRNAGTISGRHYHEGKVVYKNPEKLIFLNGIATINYKDLENGVEGSMVVKSPAEVIIPPMIWHEVVAQTDIIVLELNSIQDAATDTIKTVKP